MTSTNTPEENLQSFNQPSPDTLGLGRTPSHRSAEIVAGSRAEVLQTQETAALARYSGRFFAQLIRRLGGDFKLIEFFAGRMTGIETLSKRAINGNHRDASDLLLVDVASGFSPRALRMAKDYPHAEVIEIDLPHVLEEKQNRLRRGGVSLPPNLKFVSADLGSQSVQSLLDGRKAHLITSEGLTLYLTRIELHRLFQQAHESLADDGFFITEIYLESKLTAVRQNPQTNTAMSMIMRQIGRTPGFLPDGSAETLLKDAGFSKIDSVPLVDLMDQIGEVVPVDIIWLYQSQKGKPEKTNLPA